jgi:hypothetical protein
VRFASELHLPSGLTLDEVVEAVLEGFRLGSAGRQVTIGTLATARQPFVGVPTTARGDGTSELADPRLVPT